MKDAARQGPAGDVRIVEYAPMPPIRAVGGAPERSGPVRRTTILVWFMRTMAVVWIAKGLFAWTIVLGVHRGVADFLELPPMMRGMIGFYAVADLMAAVGLWLAAPWGGVLWLICAASEAISVALSVGAALAGSFGLVLDVASDRRLFRSELARSERTRIGSATDL